MSKTTGGSSAVGNAYENGLVENIGVVDTERWNDRGTVLERERDAARFGGAAGVVAEGAEVRGLACDHRRDAVLPCALDPDIDRLQPARLAESEPTVDMHDRAPIVDDARNAAGIDLTLADPRAVEVEQVDAVRVDAAQVGVDQRLGHEHRGVALGTERDEHIGRERAQRARADDDPVGHRSSQPGSRSSRAGWRPIRIGESGESTSRKRC